MEHTEAGACKAIAFRDKEGGQRHMWQPRPCLHQAEGRAATAMTDDVGGLVEQARVIKLEAHAVHVLPCTLDSNSGAN